jgi:NADPH2:quinone reductase
MKAVMSHEPGGPETLTLRETAMPDPESGQVRIAVKAAGVNFPDTLIIRDMYQFKPERPFAPGAEVAGVVDAVGPGAEGFAIGDRVLAGGVCGGYATHFAASADRTFKIPDSMPFDEAAAFLMTYGTSHYALKDRAQLHPGETLFIFGAAGGVGVAAVELGKAMGARVIAGVSSQEKADFCIKLGADEALVYPRALDRDAQKALSADIKRLCGGEGADVLYDAVGGDYAEPGVRALAWEGRFLVVGFPAGIPKIPLNLILLKGSQIIGVFWGAFTRREPAKNKANVDELFRLYEAGKIRPRISASFPLARASEALTLLETRKAMGKIVLNIE